MHRSNIPTIFYMCVRNFCFILFFCFVTQVHPQASSWRMIGFEYLNAGEPEKAISFFRLAVSAEPTQGRYREEFAYALQESGMYDEALHEYTAALGLSGVSVKNIKYNMALVYAAMQDYDNANQYISEVISLAPEVSSAYLNRANFHIHRKKYSSAEADYKKYLEMEIDTTQRENIERMITILENLKIFPTDALEKEEYERKKQLEHDLNEQRKRIDGTRTTNQFLGSQ